MMKQQSLIIRWREEARISLAVFCMYINLPTLTLYMQRCQKIVGSCKI